MHLLGWSSKPAQGCTLWVAAYKHTGLQAAVALKGLGVSPLGRTVKSQCKDGTTISCGYEPRFAYSLLKQAYQACFAH